MGSMLSLLIASIITTLSVAAPITFATYNVDRSRGLKNINQAIHQLKDKKVHADVYIFQELIAKPEDDTVAAPKEIMRNFKRNYKKIFKNTKVVYHWECAASDTSPKYTMCMLYDRTKIKNLSPATQAFECDEDEKSDHKIKILPTTAHVEFKIQGTTEQDQSTYYILSVHLKATHWKNRKFQYLDEQQHISAIKTKREKEVEEVIDWIWWRNRFWKKQNTNRKLVILGDFNERETLLKEPEKFKPYFTGAISKVKDDARPAGSIEQVAQNSDSTDYIFMSKITDNLPRRQWKVPIQHVSGLEQSDHDMVGFEFILKDANSNGQETGGSETAQARLQNYDDTIRSEYVYSPPSDYNVIIMEMVFVLMLVLLPCAVVMACLCGICASYMFITPKTRQYYDNDDDDSMV